MMHLIMTVPMTVLSKCLICPVIIIANELYFGYLSHLELWSYWSPSGPIILWNYIYEVCNKVDLDVAMRNDIFCYDMKLVLLLLYSVWYQYYHILDDSYLYQYPIILHNEDHDFR